MKDENLQETFAVWENMSQTPETIYAYQSRLKYMLDEEAKIADTLARGKKEGTEIGIEKGIEQVVQKMIANGKSNEDIMEATDLTFEEIEVLRET